MKSRIDALSCSVLAVSALLAFAIADFDQESGFFTFLRIAAVSVAVAVGVFLVRERRYRRALPMWAVAALYNPVFQVSLDRDTWQGLNALTILVLWLSCGAVSATMFHRAGVEIRGFLSSASAKAALPNAQVARPVAPEPLHQAQTERVASTFDLAGERAARAFRKPSPKFEDARNQLRLIGIALRQAARSAVPEREPGSKLAVAQTSELLHASSATNARPFRELRARLYATTKSLPAQTRRPTLAAIRRAETPADLLRCWVKCDELLNAIEVIEADRLVRQLGKQSLARLMRLSKLSNFDTLLSNAKLCRADLDASLASSRSGAEGAKKQRNYAKHVLDIKMMVLVALSELRIKRQVASRSQSRA